MLIKISFGKPLPFIERCVTFLSFFNFKHKSLYMYFIILPSIHFFSSNLEPTFQCVQDWGLVPTGTTGPDMLL